MPMSPATVQDRFKSLHANIISGLRQSQHRGSSPAANAPTLGPLLRITAAYVPYYVPPGEVLGVLSSWPDRAAEFSNSHGLSSGELGLHDYIITEIAVQMHAIASVKGLLRYLHGVEPVLLCSEQWKADVNMVPLLRLQGELYSLTLPGGPRCVMPICHVKYGERVMFSPCGCFSVNMYLHCGRLFGLLCNVMSSCSVAAAFLDTHGMSRRQCVKCR